MKRGLDEQILHYFFKIYKNIISVTILIYILKKLGISGKCKKMGKKRKIC